MKLCRVGCSLNFAQSLPLVDAQTFKSMVGLLFQLLLSNHIKTNLSIINSIICHDFDEKYSTWLSYPSIWHKKHYKLSGLLRNHFCPPLTKRDEVLTWCRVYYLESPGSISDLLTPRPPSRWRCHHSSQG